MTPPDALERWLRAMPKAELHLHLDGSLRPETALDLAQRKGIARADLPADLPAGLAAMRARLVAPARCLDQADLLQAFDLPVALLQDAEALERCAAELVEDVAGDGTCYAEIRWAPSLHTRAGLALREGIAAVARGAHRAAHASGIDVRLIAVALRTHSPETAAEVARAAVAALPDGLTGFDLAGLEHLAPDPRSFSAAFEIARQGGLGITCHAGEWGGAAQVRAALAIDPWRIAHGAPAVDDETLMADLRVRDVTLDLCPTSNRQAGIGSDDGTAPLPRLLRAGVPVTISTDDRTVSDLTLVRELRRAIDGLGLAPAEVVTTMRRAYAAAFLHHDESPAGTPAGRLRGLAGQRATSRLKGPTAARGNVRASSPASGRPSEGSGRQACEQRLELRRAGDDERGLLVRRERGRHVRGAHAGEHQDATGAHPVRGQDVRAQPVADDDGLPGGHAGHGGCLSQESRLGLADDQVGLPAGGLDRVPPPWHRRRP